MKPTKHTPGPWFAEGSHVYTKQGAWYIAETAITGKSFTKRGTEAEANAHLIAAAPEMLAALEALQAYMLKLPRHEQIHEATALHLQAQAAITKAKGGAE